MHPVAMGLVQRSDYSLGEYLIVCTPCRILFLRNVRNTVIAKLPAQTFAMGKRITPKSFTSSEN